MIKTKQELGQSWRCHRLMCKHSRDTKTGKAVKIEGLAIIIFHRAHQSEGDRYWGQEKTHSQARGVSLDENSQEAGNGLGAARQFSYGPAKGTRTLKPKGSSMLVNRL